MCLSMEQAAAVMQGHSSHASVGPGRGSARWCGEELDLFSEEGGCREEGEGQMWERGADEG